MSSARPGQGGPFVAPARYALTVLHAPDPDAAASPEAAEPASGAAVCGAPMLIADVWLPVGRRDGDALCPRCFPGEPGAVAEPGLW